MRARILIALGASAFICALTHFLRSYPWPLAAISGVLIGILVFVTLQTLTRLRATLSQFRRN